MSKITDLHRSTIRTAIAFTLATVGLMILFAVCHLSAQAQHASRTHTEWVKTGAAPVTNTLTHTIYFPLVSKGPPPPLQTNIVYRVEIDPSESPIVRLTARDLTGLYYGLSFQWATIADFASIRRVSDLSNRPLSYTRQSNGWIVDLDGSRGLIFEYSFPAEVLIDGRYFIKIHSQYAYLYGHALFITPEHTNGLIDVEFLLQPDWAVAVPFDSLANKVFRVNQVSQLVHNIVHAGPLERRVTTEFDELTLAYFLFEGRQASQSEMETYIDVTHRMLVELEEIFGEMASPRLNIVNSRAFEIYNLKFAGWGGWTQVWSPDRYDDLAHHLMHGWIFYEGDSTLQYWGPNFNWFLEGAPTFYQQFIPERIGLGYYPVAPGDEYYEYAMVVDCLNGAILTATNDQKSFDDLLELLYLRYAGQSFGEVEMRAAINDVAGIDLTAQFDNCLSTLP